MNSLLRSLSSGLALLALLAWAAAPATAQDVVFDSFDRTDFSDIGSFSGGADGVGIGVGPTTGIGGAENTALSVGINPGTGGSFAGIVIPGPDGNTDVTGTNFLTFSFRPVGAGAAIAAGNLTLTMEINLQEDTDGNGTFEGATDDEFRAEFRIEATGTDYQFVEIPLYAFRKVNAPEAGNGVLDTDAILQIVPVFGGMQGPEFSYAIDELVFTQDSQLNLGEPSVVFDSFDRTDFSDIGSFSGGADGVGIGVGPTTGIGGAENTALSVGINPGTGGSFAGIVIPGPDGNTDVTGTNFLTFSFRPVGAGAAIAAGNLTLTMEINLQEDTDGNGTFEGATDDEFRAQYRIEATGTDYQFVAIPLYAFRKVNAPEAGNGVLDTDAILQIVPVFGGMQGPEFSYAIDNIGFATGGLSTSAELPPALAEAPVAFPNPTAGAATVAFELASPSAVRAEVYDMLGRRVATLADEAKPAGEVRLSVATESFVPGTYIIRIQTDAGAAMTRLTVAR